MSQGTVIAVKPQGYSTQSQFMSYRSTETTNNTSSETVSSGQSINLLYIEVYEDKSKGGSKGKVKSVVWYEDRNNAFKVGDFVKFDIDKTKTRPIKGAVNVKKVFGGKIILHRDLLSIVALAASALLIGAVIIDNRR